MIISSCLLERAPNVLAFLQSFTQSCWDIRSGGFAGVVACRKVLPLPIWMIISGTKFQVMYLSFNQDGSCISVGTRRGFKVFNAVPFKALYSHDFSDGCAVVSMLYRSAILAISGAGNNVRYPRDSVTLYDDQSGRNLGEIELHHPVLQVQLTREKIFVAIDGAVLVHNLTDLRQIDKIETCANPNGILAVQGEREVQLLSLGMKPGELFLRQYGPDKLKNVQSF